MATIGLQDHIVVCNWSETARGVVEQLHRENGDARRQVVLIDPNLDSCPIDDPYVYFVKGDPTDDDTIKRAGVASADTAVVLADTSLADPGLRDAKTALITLAIETFAPEVYTVVELMRLESRKHLVRANVDEPICVNELSQRLLVHAALNHGLSRFFTDILTYGAGSEMYKTNRLPAGLDGKTFREAVQIVSDQFQAILLAIERDGEIVINPQTSFLLKAGDCLFVLSEEYPVELAQYGEVIAGVTPENGALSEPLLPGTGEERATASS